VLAYAWLKKRRYYLRTIYMQYSQGYCKSDPTAGQQNSRQSAFNEQYGAQGSFEARLLAHLITASNKRSKSIRIDNYIPVRETSTSCCPENATRPPLRRRPRTISNGRSRTTNLTPVRRTLPGYCGFPRSDRFRIENIFIQEGQKMASGHCTAPCEDLGTLDLFQAILVPRLRHGVTRFQISG